MRNPLICFNTDCFRFDNHSISISCGYTDSCNGYQISATKQLLKDLKKEGAINSNPKKSDNSSFNQDCTNTKCDFYDTKVSDNCSFDDMKNCKERSPK